MARFLLPEPPPTPPPPLGVRLRRYLLQSWRGRILIAALLVHALSVAGLPVPSPLGGLARVALFVYALAYGWRAASWVLRSLLFKIRTKLLLSYVFIAVVPVLLLTLLFAVAGLLFGGLVASHLVTTELDRQSERLASQARRLTDALEPPAEPASARLRPLLAELLAQHPGAGHAVVCPGRAPLQAGQAPLAAPDWWQTPEFHGLVEDGEREVVRALRRGPQGCLVLLELPLDEKLMAELEPRAGIAFIATLAQLGGKATLSSGGEGLKVEVDLDEKEAERRAERVAARAQAVGARGPTFAAPIDRTGWRDGRVSQSALLFTFAPRAVLRQLAPGSLGLGDRLVQAFGVLAVVFLAMYGVALVFGALLARSITRSVHALSRGTQRLRQGDFQHRIPIKSRDQLGELADSFNLMAAGIQDLLRQQGEKERLEEELRIARQIQMSLLPQRAVEMSGLRVAALCLPATEVGGDYYDLLPLGPDRLAVVVADVSGKGTSAALYMAELKGLVLSLSRVHDSPARLLCEANRILAQSLDSRTFITMTYAILDLARRRLRFARAGHNPLIRLAAGEGRSQVLAPPGLGLGIDRGEAFDRILEEAEVPLDPGDLLVFFTDGLSEAMNPQSELFGERRLRDVIEQASELGSEELKERILDEIRRFVAGAAQHDDMTLVVLRVA